MIDSWPGRTTEGSSSCFLGRVQFINTIIIIVTSGPSTTKSATVDYSHSDNLRLDISVCVKSRLAPHNHDSAFPSILFVSRQVGRPPTCLFSSPVSSISAISNR